MSVRTIQNPAFYSASPARCRDWIDELSAFDRPGSLPAHAVAGLVPHAGWAYSGAVAGAVFRTLAGRASPETIILFGTVHHPGIDRPTAYPEGAWETPLGAVEVDADLARALHETLGASTLRLGERAHRDEHSLEVQIPFIRRLFPGARILPIAVPPVDDAATLGEAIAAHPGTASCIAVGTTDLTHYGERYFLAPAGTGAPAERWMRANDERMLALLRALDADAVLEEARAHHNACGPGAVAATLAFARQRGAREGHLLRYTTSHEVRPEGEFEMAVGYAGLVF